MDAILEAKQRNRRRSERRKPRTSVKVECRKGSHGFGPNVTSSVLDVSDTGVRLVVSKDFVPQQEVEVIIAGHGVRQTIKRTGVVRWQLKLESGLYCTGVEFQKRIEYRDWQVLSSPR